MDRAMFRTRRTVTRHRSARTVRPRRDESLMARDTAAFFI